MKLSERFYLISLDVSKMFDVEALLYRNVLFLDSRSVALMLPLTKLIARLYGNSLPPDIL